MVDGSGRPVGGEWVEGAGGRSWWLEVDPPLAEGESYTLHVEGVADRSGNVMAGVVEEGFTAPAADAGLELPVGEGGEILAVVDAPEGLVLVSGVPVDPASVAGAVTVRRAGVEVTGSVSVAGSGAGAYEGRVVVWRPSDPAEYPAAEYQVTVSPGMADPAGRAIAVPGTVSYLHTGQGDVVWEEPAQTPVLVASQVGNDRFLHGRPWVASVGLYDHRARFYEPATGTFLEPDPLGPVDSPNLYQAFGFDALNVRDPWGWLLPRRALWDPRRRMYKHDGRYFQVTRTGLVYEVNANWGDREVRVTDPHLERAVLEQAGVDTKLDRFAALRQLHAKLHEDTRATEDVILLYWGAAAMPSVAGESGTAWIVAGIDATSAYLASRIEGSSPHETTRAVVVSALGGAAGARWIKVDVTTEGGVGTDLAEVLGTFWTSGSWDLVLQAAEEGSVRKVDLERAVLTGSAALLAKPMAHLPEGTRETVVGLTQLVVEAIRAEGRRRRGVAKRDVRPLSGGSER